MHILDEIQDEYDVSIITVKYEGTEHLMNELLKHFYLDTIVDWLNWDSSKQDWERWGSFNAHP